MRKINVITMSLVLMLVAFLLACSQPPLQSSLTPTVSIDGTLRPYPSGTPTTTPLPTGFKSPTLSPTVTPTATPVYYEIQLGDDMYSIAWRYNLNPGEVMTANPSVNPRAMVVGETLVIPITPMPEPTETAVVDASPTPTQAISQSRDPDCYSDSLDGLWCFLLVVNEESNPLENISASITLQDGEDIRQQTAIMPLNLLPAGESLPLVTYFQPPVSLDYALSAEIAFFLPVMPEDQRYLAVEVEDLSVDLGTSGEVAEVKGDLVLVENQADAAYIWLVATAYDADDRVVAVRRWEYNTIVSAGDRNSFTLTLYSMGGEIDRVEVLTEALRVQDPSLVE